MIERCRGLPGTHNGGAARRRGEEARLSRDWIVVRPDHRGNGRLDIHGGSLRARHLGWRCLVQRLFRTRNTPELNRCQTRETARASLSRPTESLPELQDTQSRKPNRTRQVLMHIEGEKIAEVYLRVSDLAGDERVRLVLKPAHTRPIAAGDVLDLYAAIAPKLQVAIRRPRTRSRGWRRPARREVARAAKVNTLPRRHSPRPIPSTTQR